MASGGFSTPQKARQMRRKGKNYPVAIKNNKGVTKYVNMTPEEAEEFYAENPDRFLGANRWIKEDDHNAKKNFLKNMRKWIEDENVPEDPPPKPKPAPTTTDQEGGVAEGVDQADEAEVGFFTGKTAEQKKQDEEKAKREKEAAADRATEIVKNEIIPQRALEDRGVLGGPTRTEGVGIEGTEKVKLVWALPSYITQAQRGFLQPLLSPTGTHMVLEFPYTPTINMGHGAAYGSYDLTHSVYQQQYYMNTQNPQIDMTAMFTANTQKDAAHTMAALHFLKSMVKSQFGQSNPDGSRNENAGTPPPVLRFSAYGALNFKNTPVVIRNVNFTYPEDTDYVGMVFNKEGWVYLGDFYDLQAGYQKQKSDKLNEIQNQVNQGTEFFNETKDVPGGASYIPTLFMVSLGLTVQTVPTKVRTEWNWDDYMQGSVLYKGYP